MRRATILWFVLVAADVSALPRNTLADGAPLQRAVTLKGSSLGVEGVLRRLSRETGTRITASPHLLDRWLTLRVSQLPANRVLESLRYLFHSRRYPCSIQKLKDGSLILWQHPDAAMELPRVLNEERHLAVEALERVVAGGVPNQPLAQWDDDPLLKRLGNKADWNTGGKALLQRFADLNANERRALRSGNTVWATPDRLSPQTRQLIGETSLVTAVRPGRFGVEVRPGERSGVWTFYQVAEDMRRPRYFSLGLQMAEIGFSTQEPPQEVWPRLTATPSFNAATSWKQFADFQLELAERHQLNLVSDYYHDKAAPDRSALLRAGKDWSQIFRLACAPVNYRVELREEILHFRNRRWFFDDPDEVPARLQERLLASLATRGWLLPDELAQIGALTERQHLRFNPHAPGLDVFFELRPIFLWYQSLSASARQRVASGKAQMVRGTRAPSLLQPNGEPISLVRTLGNLQDLWLAFRKEDLPNGKRCNVVMGNRTGQSFARPIDLIYQSRSPRRE